MIALVAYQNGEWLPATELAVSVDDVGFLLGATITERLRTFRGQVFRLTEHLARMKRSLTIVGLDGAAITAELAAVVPEFVARNVGQIAAEDDWTIIAFVTPGIWGIGRPTICVHGWPLRFREWADAYEHGLAAFVSEVRQVPDNCWPSELKCRSRMHYYLADKRAAAREPGARAILLDQDGFVAEATTANVLVFRDGEGLSTPPDDHVLVGISLGVVHELADRIGVPFMRRRISAEEFRMADEVMLASTSVCLLPVVRCDGRPIGSAAPGSMFRQLLSAWGEFVGVDVAAQARQFSSRD